jgi:hypothetical protein
MRLLCSAAQSSESPILCQAELSVVREHWAMRRHHARARRAFASLHRSQRGRRLPDRPRVRRTLATMHADEGSGWDSLHAGWETYRVNHSWRSWTKASAPIRRKAISAACVAWKSECTITSPVRVSPPMPVRLRGARITAALPTGIKLRSLRALRCFQCQPRVGRVVAAVGALGFTVTLSLPDMYQRAAPVRTVSTIPITHSAPFTKVTL